MTQTARAKVDGEITIADLGPPEVERLRRELSFPNPDYVRALRMNRKPMDPPRVDCVRERMNGNVIIPRGAVLEARRVLAARDIRLEFIRDERVRVSFDPPAFNMELRDYQREGIRRLAAHSQGVITFPCGTGKTSTGLGCINELRQATLVIVHTDDLLGQWLEAIRERLGYDAGIIRGGEQPNLKPITVASVFKLDRMLKDATERGTHDKILGFGFVIVDEAHHAPAETFTRVINHVPAYYRLGLTATPEREDGRTKLVEWTFGDTLSSRTVPEMVKAGWLTLPKGYAVHTGLAYEYKGGRDDKKNEATARAVIGNKKRNALVAKYAHREFNDGKVVLVLTSRLAHLPKLQKALGERGIEAITLSGKSTRKHRTETLERMRTGEPLVVVSMPIFDEGVDVPALGALLLAFPERAKGRTVQRAGRLMRPFKGETPALYDFVDDEVELLDGRWDERRRVLTKILGMEMETINAD